MTKAEQSDRIRTAYHEAGHAVVAAIYGFLPYRVTIKKDPEKNTRGEVRIRVSPIIYQLPHQLTAWMIHGLAGIAAQNRYSRKRDSEQRGGDDDIARFNEDWWKLTVMTDWNCGDWDEFTSVALWVVNRYWYAIDTFARLLLERETIECDELDDALGCAIFTEDYKYTALPEYLCPVDPCTIVDRGVHSEAEALQAAFITAYDGESSPRA